MIRLLLGLLALGLFGWTATGGAAPTGAVSKDTVLKAIEVFQKDPSSTEGLTAASTIMSFAQKSDSVHVALSKAVVPWLKKQDAPDADTRSMLLAAYVAGDVRAQLQSGKAEDDIYAGWQQVLATYDQLRQINPTVKLPEIDELKNKEKAGTLHSYAAEVQKK